MVAMKADERAVHLVDTSAGGWVDKTVEQMVGHWAGPWAEQMAAQ